MPMETGGFVNPWVSEPISLQAASLGRIVAQTNPVRIIHEPYQHFGEKFYYRFRYSQSYYSLGIEFLPLLEN